MYLYGSFITRRKETVTVHIVTGGSRVVQKEIGNRANGIFFTADPVEIRSEANDTFDPLLRSSACIRLRTRSFIPELFCLEALDAVVNITLDGTCVFAGYIVPQSYSQPFADLYDELEINCVDALSALQYARYRDIGMNGVSYDEVKSSADIRSFADILDETIGSVASGLRLSGSGGYRILYDGSLTTSNPLKPLFKEIAVSELLFLGTSEDEAWPKLDVVEEIMRYLNLRMVQEGFDFKIYSPDSVKVSGNLISWKTLAGVSAGSDQQNEITISSQNATDTDANISIGEVFNRIELTCKIEEVEALVESPLDSDAMYSPYSNRQLYVREYIADGDDQKAFTAFRDMIWGEVSTDKATLRDWYMQVYDSRNWRFRGINGDMVATFCRNNTNQQTLPNMLSKTPGAALISFGKAERKGGGKDNSLQGKLDMNTALIVSVLGNGTDVVNSTYPRPETILQGIPVAEYTGAVSGGVYSPADDETTNYIVFSGSIVLQPRTKESLPRDKQPWITGASKSSWDNMFLPGSNHFSNLLVPSKNNKGGRFYTTQWFSAATPMADAVLDTSQGTPYLYPYTGDEKGEYEFKYSAIGDSTDTVSKIAVLACMLVIGDKCVVETGTIGGISDFEWKVYKEREQCASDDEYYSQCFTLGFDPKIGDKLIGQEYELQNNIDYRMGLDLEGTAIPIRRSDKVKGKISFMILGPVYTVWDEVTRRHKTWFRSVSWGAKSVPLLAHVSNIVIKDFEAKVVTDNGLINNTDNSDLVYISATDERFVNVKDDLTFRLTTALTRDERVALGFSDSVKLSSPVLVSTGEPLLTICNTVTGEIGKPEQLFVDSYYRELHKPRVSLVHKMRSSSDIIGQFNRYIHPALPDKKFFVCGISRGLSEGWVELNLKEIDND